MKELKYSFNVTECMNMNFANLYLLVESVDGN